MFHNGGTLKSRNIFVQALLLFALLVSTHAQPPGVNGGGPPPARWSVGAGVVYNAGPWVGNGHKVLPIPLINYFGEKLRVTGPVVNYELTRFGPSALSLRIEPQFSAYEESDDPLLEGLGDRQITANGGVEYSQYMPYGLRLSALAMVELLGRYNGGFGELRLSRRFPVQEIMLRPSLFLKGYEENYGEYYFGVPKNKATLERPAYDPGGGFSYGLALSIFTRFGEHWSLQTIGVVERISEDLYDSPIVARRDEYSLIVGVSRSL